MKHVEINLGKACNNRCRFCMSGQLAAFVDFETAKNQIIESAADGYESLGFLGGEVTLYPRLLELIKIAKENGFKKIHIVSNGRRYKDKNFLIDLIKSGADRFSVSIHSHIEEVEDYLTQIKGGFQEKIKGLKNLVDLHRQGLIKDNLSINYVITKKNYQDILKSLSYFIKLGFNNFRLNFMRQEGNADIYYKELLFSYTEFYPYIIKIINLNKRLDCYIVFEGIPFCVFPNPKENKKYIGEILDINTDVINYENNTRQFFNWQDKKRNELKRKRQECQICIYNNICEGIWPKYIEHIGWNEFKPITK